MAIDAFVRCLSRTPGQPSGDAFWYSEDKRYVWAVVVDGLGSGPEAAAPAERAVECVRQHVELRPAPADISNELQRLVMECDRALRGSRGAAIGVAAFDSEARTGYYAGIGNIELRLVGQATTHATSQAGIVGARLQKVRVEQFAYHPGDLVVMHSDGLSDRFIVTTEDAVRYSLDVLGERLLDHHGTSDDLTLLLLRQHA